MHPLGVRYVVLHLGVGQYTPQQIADIVGALPPGSTARPYGDAWLVDLEPLPDTAPEPSGDQTGAAPDLGLDGLAVAVGPGLGRRLALTAS